MYFIKSSHITFFVTVFASNMAPGMAMLVGHLVQTDTHGHQRMDPNEFDDRLTFPLAPT